MAPYIGIILFSWMHAGVITDPDPNLSLKNIPPPPKQKKTLRVQDDIPWTKRRREVQQLQNLFCCVGLDVVARWRDMKRPL